MLQINSHLLRIFIILAFICLAMIRCRPPEEAYTQVQSSIDGEERVTEEYTQVQSSNNREMEMTDDVRSTYILTTEFPIYQIRIGG
ncbi:unnamed protein product [Gordionus sp. m RMFG-2023]